VNVVINGSAVITLFGLNVVFVVFTTVLLELSDYSRIINVVDELASSAKLSPVELPHSAFVCSKTSAIGSIISPANFASASL
jgi:hypothetical protein